MKKLRYLLFLSLSIVMSYNSLAQGTWTTFKHLAPDNNGGVMLLLTDGKVMCMTQNDTTLVGTVGNTWDELIPDKQGNYSNGTWSELPAMHHTRLYFSSQVLPDGNVYVAGGEYGTGGPFGEYFNTVTHQWSLATNVPSGISFVDANSKLLSDGTVLQAMVLPSANQNVFWDPTTNAYAAAPSSAGSSDEASWIKLPDGSVMTVDLQTQNSERYIPSQNQWIPDAHVPVQLYDANLGEAGASLLLPNGKLFFLGDCVNTAIYTPSGNANPGSWAVGPPMPRVVINGNFVQLGCPDAPAAMLPNGHILCAFSRAGTYNDTAWFYEFNYLTNQFTPVPTPLGGNQLDGTPSYAINMLVLPDGTVMVGWLGSSQYYKYIPLGNALAEGKPTIDSIFSTDCSNFKITGKLFNGIGEGAAYGDDWQMATNYPIVRLFDGNETYYAKTTNWNRIGAVSTGSLEDTAYFTLSNLPSGDYNLEVVANGNSSAPNIFHYKSWQPHVTAQDNILGNSTCTGKAIAMPSAANAPYTYLWTPNQQTTDSIGELCANNYCCTIKDNYGCTQQACATIKDLPTPPFAIYPEPNHGNFTIVGLTTGQKMILYNDIGQVMSQIVADNVMMNVDIANKENGIYLLTILNIDGSVMKQEKILKIK